MKNRIVINILMIAFGVSTYAKNPTFNIGFIENKGQILNQNHVPNKAVLYQVNAPNFHIQLKENGFSYEIIKTILPYTKSSTHLMDNPVNRLSASNNIQQTSYSISRVDFSFEGSNVIKRTGEIKIIPASKNISNLKYYLENGEEINAGIFNKVTYFNVYDGIDIEFIIDKENQFKYNFIVHPNANLAAIKLKIDGALKNSINKENKLLIETQNGNLEEIIPISYQENQLVNVAYYACAQNVFGFYANAYDPLKTLIIDPLPWASYFGGSSDDRANSIAVNSLGEPVITGFTSSIDKLATNGSWQTVYAGNIDVFIAHFNTSGDCLWATYFGGSDLENGIDITIDLHDHIYVTGYTLSTSGIATNNVHQKDFGGGTTYGDAYLVKFSNSGSRIWGTYYGGYDEDYGNGIVTDKFGNIYLTGYSTSSESIATNGAMQSSLISGPDAIIAKFDSNGVQVWGTYFGSTQPDYGCKIAIDSIGNLAISGITFGDSGIASSGAYQSSYQALGDAFLLKLTNSGSKIWSTYFGGTGFDYGIDVNCDNAGNIIMAGSTNSTSGIASSGANQITSRGLGEAFISKFSPGGNLLWATYYGSSADDGSFALSGDAENNIVITGFSISDSGMVSAMVHQSVFGGYDDIIVAKFNASGVKLWSTYYGSSNADEGNGIACDKNGNIFVTGLTSSTNNIASNGTYQTAFGGGAYDAIIAAFTKNGGLFTLKNNVITGSQQLCKENNPDTLEGTLAIGAYTIKHNTWQKSISSINSGYTTIIQNDTLTYCSLGKLNQSAWFRRIITSGEFSDTSNVVFVQVNSKPQVNFSINDSVQCLNENSFIFQDFTSAESNAVRIWNLGEGAADSSTFANPVKKYPHTGAFQVSLVYIANAGCKDSIVKTVQVLANPQKPTITTISNHQLESSTASAYHWYFNNSLLTDSIRKQLNIKQNGNYFVIADSSNGCGSVSDIITVSKVGISEMKVAKTICIYPNPAEDKLFISTRGISSEEITNIGFFDMQGKLLFSRTLLLESNENFELLITDYPCGIYLLMVNDDTYKITIQR